MVAIKVKQEILCISSNVDIADDLG